MKIAKVAERKYPVNETYLPAAEYKRTGFIAGYNYLKPEYYKIKEDKDLLIDVLKNIVDNTYTFEHLITLEHDKMKRVPDEYINRAKELLNTIKK